MNGGGNKGADTLKKKGVSKADGSGPPCVAVRPFPRAMEKAAWDTRGRQRKVGCALVSLVPLGPISELLSPWEEKP